MNYNNNRLMKKNILKNYICPYEEEGSECYRQNYCLFSHSNNNNANIDERKLKHFPTFICLFYLFEKCYYQKQCECRNGFHPSLQELSKLEYYQVKNKKYIDKFLSNYCQKECPICRDRICDKIGHYKRRWALMENCQHFTCFSCMKELRKTTAKCPVCRITSYRYVWSYKKEIYNDEIVKKNEFNQPNNYRLVDETRRFHIDNNNNFVLNGNINFFIENNDELYDDVVDIYYYADDGRIVYL